MAGLSSFCRVLSARCARHRWLLLCALPHAQSSAGQRAATHVRLGCQVAAPAGAGGIAHAVTHDGWRDTAASTVAALLDLDGARAAWLCAFGAVYVRGERETDPFAEVGGGAHLRVHTRPRLYPAAESTDWLGSVLAETEHFAVLDKPRGVPTHAAVDNAAQTCQARLGAALGVPLGCPHRLDVQTRGLLLLSKSAEFLEGFGRLLRERRVRKRYRALCAPSLAPDAPPPPLGELRHWILPGRYEPTILAPVRAGEPPAAGWRECVSALESTRELAARFDDDATHAPPRRVLELGLQLRTGRTHQLRAQLASLGWPVVGDTVYARGGKGAADALALAAALPVAGGRAPAPEPPPERRIAARLGADPAGSEHPEAGSPADGGFLGLVASELAFECPLGSGAHYRFELPEERLWR